MEGLMALAPSGNESQSESSDSDAEAIFWHIDDIDWTEVQRQQNADGSVTIPEALRPYMGGADKITRG